MHFKSVLQRKELRSRDVIYSRSGEGVGPLFPQLTLFPQQTIRKSKISFSGSKGAKWTHVNSRKGTRCNGLTMSWLSLTTGHYLCTSRGVQHVTATSQPVLIRAKKGQKRKCLQGPCARPLHQRLPEPGDSISGKTQALSSPTSSPSHTYSVSTCGPPTPYTTTQIPEPAKVLWFYFSLLHEPRDWWQDQIWKERIPSPLDQFSFHF